MAGVDDEACAADAALRQAREEVLGRLNSFEPPRAAWLSGLLHARITIADRLPEVVVDDPEHRDLLDDPL